MDSNAKKKLIQFLENGQVDLALRFVQELETPKGKRTDSQNRAYHLWLNMIEREAENQGVTWDMLIRHTSQLRVTAEGLKSASKQLIKALWGYTSTTQLKKTGDLDIVIDHMTDWLSKEMEVPAFPCDETKGRELLEAMTLRKKLNYPEV